MQEVRGDDQSSPSGHKAKEPIFKHKATFNNLHQLWLTVLQDWKQHKQNQHALWVKKDVKAQLMMARVLVHKYWTGIWAVQFMLTLLEEFIVSPDHFD